MTVPPPPDDSDSRDRSRSGSGPPPPPPPPGSRVSPSPGAQPPPPQHGSRFPVASRDDGSRSQRPTGVAGMYSLKDQASPHSILLALVVVVIMVSPNFVFYLLDRALAGQIPQPTEPTEGQLIFGLIFALVAQVVIFVIAMLPLLIRRRLDRSLFGPTQPTGSWPALGLGLVAGIVALFGAYGVNIVLGLLAGVEDPVEQQLLQDALRGGITLTVAGFIAIVVAPIVEEVVFRGVLFRALADRIGLLVGAVVSSAVFALIHIEVVVSQPVALGGLFVVGLVLALAYYWTGNLLVPVLGHAVFNTASLSLAVVIDRLDLEELAGFGQLPWAALGL